MGGLGNVCVLGCSSVAYTCVAICGFYDPKMKQTCDQNTLPKRKKNDKFDTQELSNGTKGRQFLFQRGIKGRQNHEGKSNGNVDQQYDP